MKQEAPEPASVETTVKNANRVVQRRNEICRAAVQLARRQGFGNVTTREIAREAGLNVATMYQYVRSKEDVVFLACQQNIAAIRGEPNDTHLEPIARLRDRYFVLIDAVDERLHEVTFVYQESRTLTGHYREEVKAGDEALVDHFEEAIINAVSDQATVPHTRLVARQMVESGYLWANKNWSLRGEVTKDEFAHGTWTMFARGLQLEGEKK